MNITFKSLVSIIMNNPNTKKSNEELIWVGNQKQVVYFTFEIVLAIWRHCGTVGNHMQLPIQTAKLEQLPIQTANVAHQCSFLPTISVLLASCTEHHVMQRKAFRKTENSRNFCALTNRVIPACTQNDITVFFMNMEIHIGIKTNKFSIQLLKWA